MKANVVHQFGPPENLKYQDGPDPQPREGEVRIRVHAATVNRVLDVSLRAGKEMYRGPVLPLIPGVDCAGVIDAVGPGVTRRKVGDRVAAAGGMPLDICPEDCAGYNGPEGMMGIKRQGGFAELVCVPACATVDVPQGLDFRHAAVVMRHVPTAWNLLFNVAELKKGETVLIMGAGGNLGSRSASSSPRTSIGATVIAAAGLGRPLRDSGSSSAPITRSTTTPHNIQDEVMKLTGGKGVNVLYDNIANPKVLPLAFMAIGMRRPARDRRRPRRAERDHQFLAPLSQADHHARPARPRSRPICRNASPLQPKARSSRRSSGSCRCRRRPRRTG